MEWRRQFGRSWRWGCAILAAHWILGPGLALEGAEDIRRDATVHAIETVIPSVVNISTETLVEIRDPFEGLFREFFGPSWGRRPEQSLGSGIIIDETGYILTNFHVVQRASRIWVTLWDGRKFQATLIRGIFRSQTAQRSDVALLKIEAGEGESFKAISFAAPDDLLLGERVIALGNPFGLGGSVSAGILSSRSRRPPLENEPLDVANWLQTDAAINPGNSGGPLVNLRGELIGINVAVFRDAQGIGFAIPVKHISEALSELFTPEGIKSLWFGAKFDHGREGIMTTAVQAESPAERAGLKVGDRVVQVNGRRPKGILDFNRELIGSGEEGDIALVIERDRQLRKLNVRMVPESGFFNAKLIRQKIGAVFQEVTPEVAASFGLRAAEGLLVTAVERGSPADQAEIKQGYLVQSFDGMRPADLVQAAKILHGKKKGEPVQMNLLVRQRRGNFLRVFAATAEVRVR